VNKNALLKAADPGKKMQTFHVKMEELKQELAAFSSQINANFSYNGISSFFQKSEIVLHKT